MAYRITWKDRTFTCKDVVTGQCILENSINLEKLSTDTLEITVRSQDTQSLPLANIDGYLLLDCDGNPMCAKLRSDDMSQYASDDVVYFFDNSELIGKFYITSVKRIGPISYELSCMSAIGILDRAKHYGGVYDGITLKDLLRDVIGSGIVYSISDDLAEIPVYGWLPIATRRENLKQVLFATGVSLRKLSDGSLQFCALSLAAPKTIDSIQLYDTASKIRYEKAMGAIVTEHSYIKYDNDESTVLFEGAVAADKLISPKGVAYNGALVTFTSPMHDLQISNGTILEHGVNYAVLSQSSDCKLIGAAYTHITRDIAATVQGGSLENAPAVQDATLVNLVNSENVLARVLAYDAYARAVEVDMLPESVRPGDAVSMTDSYGDPVVGLVESMDISISNTMKAMTTVIADYIPTGIGNYYEHMDVISADGVWTVPDSCKGKIRIVLIGGGDGGSIGSPGAEGGDATRTSFGASGEGGEPGAPGNGGKVFVITVEASSGDTFAAHIGPGGAGETADSPAQSGGDTTFGPYSSADGYPADTGYAALIGGGVYATNGPDGQPGGNGNQWDEGEGYIDGPYIEYLGSTYSPGANGENGSRGSYYGYGGLGGGAAAGSDGGDGAGGSVDSQPFADGGDGGHGATPVKAQNGSIPGQGGGGGHGGGGGGGGGPAKGPSSNSEWQGQGGPGGSGGEGGDGASGIILIYY